MEGSYYHFTCNIRWITGSQNLDFLNFTKDIDLMYIHILMSLYFIFYVVFRFVS